MVKRALAKGFRSAAVYSAVEEGAHNCVPELPRVDSVETRFVNVLSFTTTVARLVSHKVKKNSLDNVKMDKWFVMLAEAAEEKNNKV